jgi:DNA-binding transcriptional regulator YhcF (GntR family)
MFSLDISSIKTDYSIDNKPIFMNLSIKIETADSVQIQIERFIQQQIKNGELKANQRLPSTNELVKKWGVSYTATQKALARLAAQGLLERTPHRGTFVRGQDEKPLIGLMIGADLAEESEYFSRGLVKALRGEIEKRNWICRLYDGCHIASWRRRPFKPEVYHQFLSDFRNRSFKGLILVSPGDIIEIDISLPKVVLNEPVETDLKVDWYSG